MTKNKNIDHFINFYINNNKFKVSFKNYYDIYTYIMKQNSENFTGGASPSRQQNYRNIDRIYNTKKIPTTRTKQLQKFVLG